MLGSADDFEAAKGLSHPFSVSGLEHVAWMCQGSLLFENPSALLELGRPRNGSLGFWITDGLHHSSTRASKKTLHDQAQAWA